MRICTIFLLVVGAAAAPAFLSTLSDPLSSLAQEDQPLLARQACKAPPPCVRATPEPSANATQARHEKFVQAFLVKKNITEAFEYITKDYIVRQHL